jgi:hypothetical protein
MNRNESLIKNTGLERMALRIANDQEATQYVQLAGESTARATAYVTRKVVPVFEYLVEKFEQEHGNGSIEQVKNVVYRRDRR